MDTTHKYATITQALENLKEKGYSIDYNIEFDSLEADASNFKIDVLYRYEGDTDPADESSVYGISNTITNEKGVFVAGNLSFLEGKKRNIILALEMKYQQSKTNIK